MTHVKESYYFPHDSNARHDPKILEMRSVYGTEGYGWYWIIVEMLREQNDFKLKISGRYASNALAMEMQCEPDAAHKFLIDCIEEFNLFETDGEYFWSNSLLRRMEIKQAKSEQASKAAQARWDKEKSKEKKEKKPEKKGGKNADIMQVQCVSIADAMQVKESKVKESKVKDIKKKDKNSLFSILKKLKVQPPPKFEETTNETNTPHPNYYIIHNFKLLPPEEKIGALVQVYMELFPGQKKLGPAGAAKANDMFRALAEYCTCPDVEAILKCILYHFEGEENVTPWQIEKLFKDLRPGELPPGQFQFSYDEARYQRSIEDGKAEDNGQH